MANGKNGWNFVTGGALILLLISHLSEIQNQYIFLKQLLMKI